jgi:hypothetical protein
MKGVIIGSLSLKGGTAQLGPRRAERQGRRAVGLTAEAARRSSPRKDCGVQTILSPGRRVIPGHAR